MTLNLILTSAGSHLMVAEEPSLTEEANNQPCPKTNMKMAMVLRIDKQSMLSVLKEASHFYSVPEQTIVLEQKLAPISKTVSVPKIMSELLDP